MTDKVDVKKSLDSYRAKHGTSRVLDVPDLQYLMIDGHGPQHLTRLRRSHRSALPGGVQAQVRTLSEGRCVQTLHVGSFDDEAPVLAQMHDEFIPGEGPHTVGKHHEIYLSDFRKVAPEKQRTIRRQPVAT